jgi:hypothetical protein
MSSISAVFSGLHRFGRCFQRLAPFRSLFSAVYTVSVSLFSAACAVSVVVFSGLRRFGRCFQQLSLFRSCYAL